MRQLHIITVQPDDLVYWWQMRTQLTNFRRLGYSHLSRVLVFIPNNRIPHIHPKWLELEKDFPESKFFFYMDDKNITGTFIHKYGYIPLLRPHTLKRHFDEYPELSKDAILYIDSDVVFTKHLDFGPLLEDDINYLTNTESYISAAYFDSKLKDVRPDRLDAYTKRDILQEALNFFNLTREVAVNNQKNTGGAQYLLKNIDGKFWEEVFNGCLYLIMYLHRVNEIFFPGITSLERSDKGFQKWCADMWSVLWTLWKRGGETRTPEVMNHAWAPDPIEKWDECHIYHDAQGDKPHLFNKRDDRYIGRYVPATETPFDHDLSFVDKNSCSYKYVQEILAAKP